MHEPPPAKKPPKMARSVKEKAQDELVMQTNSSSIVSKRSVERIYYPDEPHFFRYFVKKFQRRAPLINRGYHLRLHAIDLAVRRFLERPSDKTKVVINLGCGSDVLPWQCMTRYPGACHRAKFIDIDFPDLMLKKRTVVLNTPELSTVFEPLDTNAGEHVILKSNLYSQIGCDLRDTTNLEKALSICLGDSDCEYIFVAEVSITYMETLGADGVIKWASTLNQAEFCLLEQILPDGPDHPFAKTMLSHFEKLKTPLKSVFKYPHLEAQKHRFSTLGWSYVDAVSLWQIWTNNNWISASQRRNLDLVEPFDEWEEFALFASHYCVVTARNFACESLLASKEDLPAADTRFRQLPADNLLFAPYIGAQGKRRFAAPLNIRDESGERVYVNTFGLGTNNRLKSCDLYAFNHAPFNPKIGAVGPSSRVCHAVADLGRFGSLLVGGRTSPMTALRDCWHFSVGQNKWSPTDDLPVPLYRHGVTRLGRSGMTLLLGGKSDSSTVFAGCLVHKPGSGWIDCAISGAGYNPVFGAILVCFKEHRLSKLPTMCFEGILAGGLLDDGTVAQQLCRWRLELPTDGKPTIFFQPLAGFSGSERLVCRFGASAISLSTERVVVVGGVQPAGILSQDDEIIMLDASKSALNITQYCLLPISSQAPGIPRPLLVGTSLFLGDRGQLVIVGGGATCFSMGTYWNEGCYTMQAQSYGPALFRRLIEVENQPPSTKNLSEGITKLQRAAIVNIPRIRINAENDFEEIVRAGKPVVIESSELGPCVQKWTGTYLVEHVGPQRSVTVHEASSSSMDFNLKNFSYKVKEFACFMAEVEKGEKQYFRALCENDPQDRPANIEIDFPGLAEDFLLPSELSFIKTNEFSSVLRISGRVNMWLHYDVMANVYCQITGSKRLRLFPPDDVGHLSFAPGASSSSIDAFSELDTPALALTHPHEATLGPGDILFLPPLWMHATAPMTDFGVAVNVFFRSLQTGYSSGRDVYGNRDVAAYEKGRRDVARITDSFSKLPRDVRAFYIRRLADEIAQGITE